MHFKTDFPENVAPRAGLAWSWSSPATLSHPESQTSLWEWKRSVYLQLCEGQVLARKEDPSSSCRIPAPQSPVSCIPNSWLSAKDSILNQFLSTLSPGLLNPSLPSAFCLLSSEQATPALCRRESVSSPGCPGTRMLLMTCSEWVPETY